MKKAVVLPPGPLCKRCGHEPCPMCETWCDILDCEQCGLNTENSECDLDADGLKKWLAEIEPLLEIAYAEERPVVSGR